MAGALVYENAGSASLAAGVTSFGKVFAAGELTAGKGLAAVINGQACAVQVDVKTTYADGSAKMVVVTMERPSLAAGATAEVQLTAVTAGTPISLDFAAGLARHDFSVARTDAQGQTAHIDVIAALKAAVASGDASFWQMGPLAVQARVQLELAGSVRMVFDVTLFQGGGMNVEAQINNDGAMGAVGGRVAHSLVFTMDGREVTQASLDQGQYQNWHESFSSTGLDGGQGLGSAAGGWLNLRHDIAALQETGAVARYDLSQGVDASLLSEMGAAAAAPAWDVPLGTRGVTQYMPGTGGRADIGFTTEGNTAWLMTQDARAASFAMGQAEAASAIPWHLWDARNKNWLSTEDYPNLWTDGRGGTGLPGDATSGGLTQQPDEKSGWELDSAHQPDLSYVPYLLTGQRWMLDNVQAQASWNLMSQWPAIRRGAEDLVVRDSQVRGAAWSLRQIDEAAWASPNGSAEKATFTEASTANWAWLVAQIPRWTAEQGEAHGWIPGVYGTSGALPPWQQDYFASTAIAAARHGNADALTFLTWQSNFLVGRFTHAQDGFPQNDGAAYLIAIADATTGSLYKTWAQIGAQTAARDWSNGNGWSNSQGDYAQLALATLAGIADVLDSSAAANAYSALIAKKPPFTGTADYTRDPTYAIAAPGSVPTSPSPTPPPSPSAVSVEAALAVVLGAEAWEGNPIAVVLVNGVEAFRGEVSALHASGGAPISLGVFSTSSTLGVSVHFLNDGWGGSAATDRNLYVEDVLVNGVSTGKNAALMSAGEVAFTITPPAPPVVPPAPPPAPAPVIPVAGEGADLIRLGLSGKAWEGSPRFLVLLDGAGVAEWQADASHAQGKVGYFDLRAGLGTGAHAVTIRFLNDAWGGTAATDRNLYVNSLSINGVDKGWSADLLVNRDATFTIPAAIHVLNGTAADEKLSGTAGADRISGLAGKDTLFGLAGDDVLIGGDGDDVLDGGTGANRLEGGGGNDTYYANSVGDVPVEAPDAGYDRVMASISWTLGTELDRLTLSGTGNLNGTGNALANRLDGNSGANILDGGAGNDGLFGYAGNDRLAGGLGNDTLDGGLGADRMEGGADNDIYYVDHVGDVVVEAAGGGSDRIMASLNWTLGTEVERLSLSGTGNLNGTGNALVNRLDGNAGANILDGGAGNDSLYGGAGNDGLVGGAGADILDGGLGADRLQGGVDGDRFYFRSAEEANGDVIADFSAAQGDRIDLRGIDADAWLAGDQAFAWIGGSGFAGVAGQLRFAGGLLQGDLDGNGAADFQIGLTAAASLTAATIWL